MQTKQKAGAYKYMYMHIFRSAEKKIVWSQFIDFS